MSRAIQNRLQSIVVLFGYYGTHHGFVHSLWRIVARMVLQGSPEFDVTGVFLFVMRMRMHVATIFSFVELESTQPIFL